MTYRNTILLKAFVKPNKEIWMLKMKRIASILLALTIVVSLLAGTTQAKMLVDRERLPLDFPDSDEASWAVHAIGKMKHRGILNGYDDGTYRPDLPVSRIEAIVAAVRLMGLEEETYGKVPAETLTFHDAAQVEADYGWAMGYLAVAMEQDLILPTIYTLNPGEPATRSFITVLMIRALKLGFMAYDRRTHVPDFLDAADFPEETYGHVAVALEYGLIRGYPDGKFLPNKQVTRAEMAVFLDRTCGIKEDRRANHLISGVIRNFRFDDKGNGIIIVESYNGKTLEYGIDLNLHVIYKDGFIPATELKVNDAILLRASYPPKVFEAAYLDPVLLDPLTGNVVNFRFNLLLWNGEQLSLYYAYEDGKLDASINGDLGDMKTVTSDKDAVEQIRKLLIAAQVTTRLDDSSEYMYNLLRELGIASDSVDELKLKYTYSDGRAGGYELHNAKPRSNKS